MNRKYRIGHCKAFYENDTVMIGQIIFIHKDYKKPNFLYDFEVVSDQGKNYIIRNIEEDSILEPAAKFTPPTDDWISSHIELINKVFQRDLSKNILVVYDSPDQVEDELKEFFNTERTEYFRKVLDKWVGILG